MDPSRGDLVALTGLTPATITHLTGQFVRNGVLEETRAPVSGMGRPRLELRVNPNKRRVAGVSMQPGGLIEIVIANLRGERLFTHLSLPHSRPERVEHFAEIVADAIEDVDTGIVHWLQTYPVRPAPFGEIVRERLGKPVFVGNSFDVLARAENWFGANGSDDFCLVGVGIWMSLSQYVGGALSTGASGMSCELAHIKVAPEDERVCVCGSRGCLAMFSTAYGVVSQVCAARSLPMVGYQDLARAFDDIVREHRAGDAVVREIFDRAATWLGIGLANFVNMHCPERIILLSSETALMDMLRDKFLETLDANTLHAFRGKTRVEFTTLDKRNYVEGSAALALEHLNHLAGG